MQVDVRLDKGPEISANNFKTDHSAQDLGARSGVQECSGFGWIWEFKGMAPCVRLNSSRLREQAPHPTHSMS